METESIGQSPTSDSIAECCYGVPVGVCARFGASTNTRGWRIHPPTSSTITSTFGSRGGTRTHKPVKAADFESAAFANSATRPRRGKIVSKFACAMVCTRAAKKTALPHVVRAGIDQSRNSNRTQTEVAGTKAKAKIGEVLSHRGHRGHRGRPDDFPLCPLCPLWFSPSPALLTFVRVEISSDSMEKLNLSTEGTEEDRMLFLRVLCALCGLALLMLPSFFSVSQILRMARII